MLGFGVLGQLTLGEMSSGTPGVYLVAGGTGIFTLTGQDATLHYPPRLIADSATYTLTGQVANFRYDRPVLAETAYFALTGQDASVVRRASLVAERGTFALSGQTAGFVYSINLAANVGVFTITGQRIDFRRTTPKVGIVAYKRGTAPIRARSRFARGVH